jgi:flagellar biosynthesis GTPase FlhF
MAAHGMNVRDKTTGSEKRMMPRAFRAKTMPAALAAVEKALGNEALIVSVHPIPAGPSWKLWRRSGVEVVAMPSAVNSLYADPADPPSKEESGADPGGGDGSEPSASAAQEAGSSSAGGDPKPGPVSGPKDSKPVTVSADPELPPPLSALRERLLDQGVESEWLAQVLHSIVEGSNARILADDGLTRELVRQELLRRLRSDGGACLMRQKVIFLVGSSGCGKTSACAKIASYAMKALGKHVHCISADATRAGAIAKARAFTAPLGIPLQLAYRPEELPALLHWETDSDLFLIDTPGSNPYRADELNELDSFAAEIPDRHILWVAPATGKESDLEDMYTAFSHLGIGGVVVTRLDETRSLGGLFNFLRRSQLPLAFLSHGSRIQGDLRTGETALLAGLLLGEKPF